MLFLYISKMFLINKKVPTFQSRLKLSAISFRLPSDSIPTAASSDSPLSTTFVSDDHWAFHFTICIALFLLSVLRCFRILSSASVLDSDYSASVSSFPSSS